MQIDLAGLRKTRTQFELQFMTVEDIESNQYPEEVLRMLASAPSWTGPMVRSQVQQIPWTEPLVRFGVQAILDY